MVDLLDRVRDTTAWVLQEARDVTLDAAALGTATATLAAGCPHPRPATDEFLPLAQWDFDVHYFDGGPLTVQYLLVLDALNFCFWPSEGLEYDALARGLKAALQRDPHALDAPRLAKATPETVLNLVGVALPTPDQRVTALREIGLGLGPYNGRAADLVTSAGRSAAQLVRLVAQAFPAFQDHAVYRGRQVHFYKRAQIFVADVWGAFGGRGLGRFDDIGRLTMFADYRVPQLLRQWGVLRLSAALQARVDAREELPAGAAEEVELRAATVQAVEAMRGALWETHGVRALSVHIDWLLWQQGEAALPLLPPHHRTLTPYY